MGESGSGVVIVESLKSSFLGVFGLVLCCDELGVVVTDKNETAVFGGVKGGHLRIAEFGLGSAHWLLKRVGGWL